MIELEFSVIFEFRIARYEDEVDDKVVIGEGMSLDIECNIGALGLFSRLDLRLTFFFFP